MRLALPVLCALGASALAAAEPRLVLSADAGLREAALRSAPTSLLADPAAAAAVAATRAVVTVWAARLVEEDDLPPLPALLRHLDQAALIGLPPEAGQDPLLDRFACVADVGPAAEACAGWWESLAPFLDDGNGGEEMAVAGFTGRVSGGVLVARRGTTFLMAPVDEAAAVAAAVPAPTVAPALRLDWDLAGLVAGCARWAELEPGFAVLDEITPAWGALAPRLRGEAIPDPAGWRARLVLDGLHQARWSAIDPAFAALARPGADATVGLALPPRVLVRLALLLHDPVPGAEDDRAPALVALADHLTGEALAQASWRDRPRWALALRCLDAEGAAAALPAAAAALGALPAADGRWTLPRADGAAIALVDDRLVLGSDEAAVSAWLAGAAGGGPQPSGTLWARLELPQIAQRLLPLLPLLLPATAEPGEVPTAGLIALLARTREEIRAGLAPAPALAAALADPVWRSANDELSGVLFPGPSLAAAVAASAALYAPEGGEPADTAVLVVRLGDQALLVSADGSETWEAAKLGSERLGGYRRLAGEPPDRLVPGVPPPAARATRALLPPMATVLAHLRPWELRVTADADALIAEERGLPLATALAAWGAVVGWRFEAGIDQRIAKARFLQQRAEVRGRHGAVLAALQRVADALAARKAAGREPPAKLSELVADGVALAELAALRTPPPARAEDLDTLGWDPAPRRWPRARLRIPLEPGWEARLGLDDTVEVEARGVRVGR